MNKGSEFDRLESYVSTLLAKYEQLLEKHKKLQKRVEQREEEILELKAKITSADTERGDISRRIKGLIDQIEEWETGLEDGVEAAGHQAETAAPEDENQDRLGESEETLEKESGSSGDQSPENPGSREKTDADVDGEVLPEASEEEREGGQQHLFSVGRYRSDYGK